MQDLHWRLSVCFLAVILSWYAALTVNELHDGFEFPDYNRLVFTIKDWDVSSITGYDYHIKYALGKASLELGNPKIVPFMFTLATLVMTFMFARQISGRNYAGLIAVIITIAAWTFRHYDTTAAYDNYWVFFIITALYMTHRLPQSSPIFFVAALLSKSTTIFFLPAMISFVLLSKLPRNTKMFVGSVYAVMTGGVLVMSSQVSEMLDAPFSPYSFMAGMGDGITLLMKPDLWLAALIPIVIILLFMTRGKMESSLGILLVSGTIFGGVVEGFVGLAYNEPYRYMPLIVLTASSLGLIIESLGHKRMERLRMNSVKL